MVSQSTMFNVGGICNLVLFIGLFTISASSVDAIPIPTPVGETVKYPINVACECMFTLYVDGVYVGEGNKKRYDPNYWPFGWNDTKKYYPVIYENQPKIVAFNGIGDEYTVLPNGFIMDMNSGNDYTKYKEWKCKDFSKTVDKSPPANWFTYEYDDSGWDVSTSYGANYQNNSYQIFENPREFISLNAEWLWTKDNSDANIYCRKKNIATSMVRPPATVSTTIQLPVRTHPQITSTVAPPPVSTSMVHPPATTSMVHPPATSSTVRPPATTSMVHPPATVSTTIHLPVRTHPQITSTVAHPPVSTTIHLPERTHPQVTSTVAPPLVSTTIHLPERTHPQITSTIAHPPVSTTIHLPERTHPHVTSTIAHPPMSTSVVHPPATSSVVHLPVSTTIHKHPSINIKIVINNIKYSQGISDKQVAHLLESVKFYNQNQYRNEHNDHSSRLYRTVLTTRLDIIRHYQMLVRHLEHLERIEHFEHFEHLEHHSRDEDTNTNDYDDKLPRHSVDDSTSKNNIIQSMIKLNSRIKQIEDSIHFIKGNHKYLLLRLLRLLKQQYKKDTMKIFNI